MPTLRTTFDVSAPPEQVWTVLTDFPAYAEWNDALPAVSGELREGATVALTLALPGRPDMNVKAVLQEVVPNRRLTWRGHLATARVFTGYREFVIDPAPGGGVRVTHVEDLSGLIAPLFGLLMGRAARRHHEGFNEALKRQAEALGR